MREIDSKKSKPLTIEGRLKLYATLGGNLVAYKIQLDYLFCESKNNHNYYIHLFRNITFIALDLCVELRACLISKNTYENRYHIKYLLVNIYEAIRAIYNKENDKYSYLNKLKKIDTQVLNKDCYCEIIRKFQLLQYEFDRISDARNSYVHYDENILDTYNHLVDIKSEECATQWSCDLLGIFQQIKNLCESNSTLSISETWVPSSTDKTAIIVHLVHNEISNNENLKETIMSTISNATKDLDSYVNYLKLVNRINQDLAVKIYPILNIHMLILIMRADIAVAVKAFLQSQDSIECMMTLRRIAIIKHEGLSHLQRMWQKLPNSLIETEEKELIGVIIKGETGKDRHKATHYRYKRKDYISEMYKECNNSTHQLKILREVPNLLNVLALLNKKLVEKLKICQNI